MAQKVKIKFRHHSFVVEAAEFHDLGTEVEIITVDGALYVCGKDDYEILPA